MTCALRPTLVTRSATNHILRFALRAAGADVPTSRIRRGKRRFGPLVLLVAIATVGGPAGAGAQVPIEIVHQFSDGGGAGRPTALVQGADGSLYGAARTPADGDGTIFRLTPDGAETVLHRFTRAEGIGPLAFLQAADGNFYGVTDFGGASGYGTIFRMTPAGEFTTLHSFEIIDGAFPRSLIQAADGTFYGTTLAGGAFSGGTAFRVTAAGAFTILHSFSDAEGRSLPSALLQAPDGNFYGLARGGNGFDSGTVFRMAPDGATTTVRFDASGTVSALALAAGNLYGIAPGRVLFGMNLGGVEFLHCALPSAYSTFTMLPEPDGSSFTVAAGSLGQPGAILKVTSDCAVTVLHAIDPAADGNPSVLLRGADGNLYGAAGDGGAANLGTVFRMTPAGAFSVIHTFLDGPEGRSPTGDLVQATSDGNFYGTTSAGGTYGRGTTFMMNASGVVTTLHSFTGGGDGSSPAGLVAAGDGNFYGTTLGRPSTAFRMTPGGTVTTVYKSANSLYGSILFASDGNLYGNMFMSGSDTMIFRLSLSGVFTPVRQIAFATYGYVSSLVQAPDGNLYGQTSGRSASDVSTVFRMSLDGSVFTPLASFPPLVDFEGPFTPDPLVGASDGNLYGTVFGANGFPPGLNVFQVALNGTVSSLYQVPGYSAMRLLKQGRDLNFYGMVSTGVFRMPPNQATVTILIAPPTFEFVSSLLEAFDGRWYGVTSGGFGRIVRFDPRTPTVAPSSLIVAPSGLTGVKLAWSPVSGATSYTIRRGPESGTQTVLVSGVSATTFIDTTVARGQRYYYIVTAVNQYGESVASYEVSISAGHATVGDFDGDGVADAAVFRRLTGTWYVRGVETTVWGGGADVPVPGDYDGDTRADVAVYRPSTGVWYLTPSSIGFGSSVPWGGGADIPVPGDYDGDGTTDVAVYRPSTGEWFILQSSTHTGRVVVWGGGADVPVARDYDGDGTTDLAVFRPSTGAWYILESSTQVGRVVMWGAGGDVPVAADYDGDGLTDVAVFRPSTGAWYILASSTGGGSVTLLGAGTDVPVPADYDGDGKTDVTVFRPSTGAWFINQSSTFLGTTITWGSSADIPVLKP